MISGWIDGGLRIARTKPLVVSKLAIALECPLKYLLETENLDVLPLPKSIPALLGTAIHSVCSITVKPSEASPSSVRKMVANEFERLIREHPVAVSILTALNVPVASGNVVPQAEFVARAGVAYKAIQIRKNHHEYMSSTPRSAPAEMRNLRRYGSEVPLESNVLDLIGRADLIEKTADGAIKIVEYKTGSVRAFNSDAPKAEFWVQVGAYALMAIERISAVSVALRIVTPDKTWERDFSIAFQTELAALLCDLRTKLSRDKSLAAAEIATPGRGCRWCSYRHVCIAYKEYAELQWESEDGRNLPQDVWGVVTEKGVQSGSLVEIRVLDSRSRHVRIRNAPSEIVSGEIRVGSHLRAFGLMSNENGRGMKYPQNFYVADIDRSNFSAFSALFLGI